MMKRQQQSDGSTAAAAVDDRQALRYGVGTTIEEVEVGSALGRGLKQMMMLLHAADTHPGGAVVVSVDGLARALLGQAQYRYQ